MAENDESFPRSYEGKELTSLNLDPVVAGIVQRVIVVSETAMIMELPGQTLRVTVHRPLAEEQSWTIRVEHTLLVNDELTPRKAGNTTVVAEALPIKAIKPKLPSSEVIDAAFWAASESDAREQMKVRLAGSFNRAVQWIAPGARLGGQAAEAILNGRASVSYELSGTDVVITLKVNAGPDLSLATELIR